MRSRAGPACTSNHGGKSRPLARLPEPEAVTPEAGPAPEPEGPPHVLVWTHLAAVIVGVALASAVWALL